VALVLALQTADAQAGVWRVKESWCAFWTRVGVDTCRNNAWPAPFTCIDQQAVRSPLATMTDKGWSLQNTIPDQLFDPETQELTRAGALKIQWILTQMPVQRRSVFVMRGRTAQETEARLRSVEAVVVDVVGDTSSTLISVTDTVPPGGSGDYYERVSRGYETTAPPPRLPEMEDASEGGN
jgi:hypothetical protein